MESPVAVPAVLRFLQNLGIETSLSLNWNRIDFLYSDGHNISGSWLYHVYHVSPSQTV